MITNLRLWGLVSGFELIVLAMDDAFGSLPSSHLLGSVPVSFYPFRNLHFKGFLGRSFEKICPISKFGLICCRFRRHDQFCLYVILGGVEQSVTTLFGTLSDRMLLTVFLITCSITFMQAVIPQRIKTETQEGASSASFFSSNSNLQS